MEPTFKEYAILVAVCLPMAVIGLYFLSNFKQLFRGSIKNEIVRRNVAAWFAIFFITGAMSPISSGFFYTLGRYGVKGALIGQLISTTICTLISFNVVWAVSENKRLKKLPFLQHHVLILVTLILMILAVNIPVTYCAFKGNALALQYTFVSSIYVGGAAGLIYAAISYLNLEKKRKFDEKELEVSRLRELKAKAELDALHSKINPHFLYNALNSIADLSITDGKKARKMTVALADLFRYSINYSDHNYSTIKEEVEMAEVYLQIEKIRFEDQLNYSVSIVGDLSHYLVPRFVLQPIVENAVKHGLKATGKMTEIEVIVKMDNGGLIIAVSDNGPAFPEELTPGYGVKSMYDKLDLLFPGAYEVHFTNQPRKQVSILINKLMKNEPVV